MNTYVATPVLAAVDDLTVPYVPANADELDGWPPFPFPNLGKLVPECWERTGQTWLVGARHVCGDRMVLSCDEFKRQLGGYILRHPGHGFGVVDDGDCQAVVAAFRWVEE